MFKSVNIRSVDEFQFRLELWQTKTLNLWREVTSQLFHFSNYVLLRWGKALGLTNQPCPDQWLSGGC